MLDKRAMVRFQFYTAYKVASQEMEVKNIQQATERLHLQPSLKNIINFVV